jgi:DNA repair exonuclease SbcCD ATPase subunit
MPSQLRSQTQTHGLVAHLQEVVDQEQNAAMASPNGQLQGWGAQQRILPPLMQATSATNDPFAMLEIPAAVGSSLPQDSGRWPPGLANRPACDFCGATLHQIRRLVEGCFEETYPVRVNHEWTCYEGEAGQLRNTAEQGIVQLQQHIRRLEEDAQNFKTDNDRLTTESQKLESSLANSHEQLQQYTSQLNQATEALRTKEAELEGTKATVEPLRSTVDELEGLRKSLQSDKERLSEDLSQLKSSQRNLRAELDLAEENHQGCAGCIKALKDDLAEAGSEHERQQEDLDVAQAATREALLLANNKQKGAIVDMLKQYPKDDDAAHTEGN